MSSKKIIVALNNSNLNQTLKLVNILKEEVFAFKIGYQFFFNFGITGYKKIYSICPRIFLDLKLHDIPNTVKKGLEALKKINPIFTTIHISGGDSMMASSKKSCGKTKVIGVSILTSLDAKQTKKYYNQKNISLILKKYCVAAKKNGLDGIVCSPNEIRIVRKLLGKNFLIITPGIRMSGNLKDDDQKRVESPKKAIDMGANYLVIGRPITQSKNPLKTIKEINKSIL